MVDVAANLRQLRDHIASIALRCGREPATIRLLAVTKTFPPEVILEAYQYGQRLFGESRVQEAEAKIPRIQRDGIEWHLIGHLQSNKVRAAARLFDSIQSLDSARLARKLSRVCGALNKTLPVLVQVNIGEEPQKHGVFPDRVFELVQEVESLPHLQLKGLMAIPPFREDPEASRPYFRRMAQLLEQLNRDRSQPLQELSLGMTHDYPVAIEEGSTLVRIGTALFGTRHP